MLYHVANHSSSICEIFFAIYSTLCVVERRALERRAPERWRSGAEPFCRSAVGAPLQEAGPERCRSAAPEKGRSAPGALALRLRSSKQWKSLDTLQKFRATRSLFWLLDSYFMKNYIPTGYIIYYIGILAYYKICLAIYNFNFARQNMLCSRMPRNRSVGKRV